MNEDPRRPHRILQGATYDRGDSYYSLPFKAKRDECGQWVNAVTGVPVIAKPQPAGDLVPRDFTGCTVRVQLRKTVTSPFVLEEFTSVGANPTIVIDGPRIYFPLSATLTASMKYGDREDLGEWTTAIGQVEVTHTASGRVERIDTRQWELDPESTK